MSKYNRDFLARLKRRCWYGDLKPLVEYVAKDEKTNLYVWAEKGRTALNVTSASFLAKELHRYTGCGSLKQDKAKKRIRWNGNLVVNAIFGNALEMMRKEK